jgi:hypothetical protein
MRQGGFAFENNPDNPVLTDPLIRWVSPTGQKSAPLTGLHAVSGEFFPLAPHPTNPYFKPEDGGSNGIYGRWINKPGVQLDIVNTKHIALVTTSDGAEISTLLALTKGADAGNYQSVTPQELGKFFANLIGKAVRGAPENDGTVKSPPPKRARRRKPPGKTPL